ncbi:hypothetical protein [Aurantivibrio infirmus]
MMKIYGTIFLIFLSSCASTRMTSFVDPAFRGTSYSSVLVSSNIAELEGKGFMESTICARFLAYGIDCSRSIDIFPPTRQFTDEQWLENFNNSGAQALIAVELTDAYSTQTYVPQTTTTSGNVTSYGNTAYYNQSTNTSGGYNINKPVEKYKITIIDGTNGKVAMIATSTTGGNAFAKSSNLAKSLAAELLQQLINERLITNLAANK